MFKILTLNTIAPIGLKQFPVDRYAIAVDIKDPDAVLVRSADLHELTFPSTIKVVGRAGAGVNNIPVAHLTKLGIPVLNTPGANANAVRELVIGAMLLASRHICEAWNYVNTLQASDDELEKRVEQDKKQFVGFELMGKTLGIVGLGSVGVKVANAAISLGMHVVGYDPTITVSRAWELSAEVQQAHSLVNLLQECDFVSIHVPLNDETRNMIGHAQIRAMKSNAVLLNFARDGIVDNQALLAALNEKKISSYVNDFPCAELRNHPLVISLPHLGASTGEAEENCAVMIVKQVRGFLEKGSIVNSVNFPNVDMPMNKLDTRLAIVNANIPNMVAQVSSILGRAGLNIVSLINKSRDDIAYTLIDVNADASVAVLKEIASISGIVHVRKI